ncbi:MAG: hypothetical protein RIR26_2565 [Pseudomonadota bacterium]|jgi:hypothetical protein
MNTSKNNSLNAYVFAGFVLLSSGRGLAQEKTSDRLVESKTTTSKKLVKGLSSGFSAIIGAEYGSMTATPTRDQDNIGIKTGSILEVELLGGLLDEKFLYDGGIGWYSYKVRGKERLIDANKKVIDGDREIGVSGLFFQFAPSYRLTDNAYIGLVTQLRMPALMDYLSEESLNTEEKTGTTQFGALALGAQFGIQFFNSELNSRLVFKVQKNLGLKNWSDIQYTGGLQFGLPLRQPDSLVIRKTTVVNKVKDVVEYKKRDFNITISSDVIKLALDNTLNFYIDTQGRPTLTPESQAFLVDLGNSLQSSLSSWDLLRIDSETKKHSQIIRDSLVSTGVPSAKVKVGRTLEKLEDGGNISVDFTFTGVKNTKDLASAIRNAMIASKVPENCKKGVCE